MNTSKNLTILSLILLIVTLATTGCKKDSLCNCLESTGSEITEIRNIGSFSNIEMNNNVDVVLKKGNTNTVSVTSGKNLIDGIVTEVENNVLVIRNKNKCNWLRDFKNKFIVEITYEDINYITNNGSGNLSCADTIRTSFLQIDNWNGTGELNVKLDCDEVYFKLHTGPADIIASGKTNYLYIYSKGNGFVKAAEVITPRCDVTNGSTGDCEINSDQIINANIEYNGDVYYKGNPPVIEAIITGNGKLIPF